MAVVMLSRGRRKRKGSFMVLGHTVSQRRSESRVGWFRADARVIKEKSHCFGCHWPTCQLWELSWQNLKRDSRTWGGRGTTWAGNLDGEGVKLKL